MNYRIALLGLFLICGLIGINACAEDQPALLTKSDIRSVIAMLDTDPPTQPLLSAIAGGCQQYDPAEANSFVEGFLGAIGGDTSLADDPDIQNDIDNLEGVDLSDLAGTCS